MSQRINAPVCEACGAIMVLRTARNGVNKGKKFWGCSSFPKCRNTKDATEYEKSISFTSDSMDVNFRPTGFKEDFVVFDIETTGFNPYNDRITEICGLLIRDGILVPDVKFSTFVNPQKPIPHDVIRINGITDKMVANAPLEHEAVRSFLDFSANKVLIAHNAKFDIGFINSVISRNSMKYDLICIDTLALSRFLYPSFENHKLDTLAVKLSLGEFNHHRAEADTNILASVFLNFLELLECRYNLNSISTLERLIPFALVK